MRRSYTVGMLIPDITNPFFPRMVRGAEDSLHGAGYTLVLADTDNDPDQEQRHRDVMLERQVDGLLLATARRRDRVIDGLIAAEVPFVLVNRTVDRGQVAAVIPDDRAGMALAVEHLYAQGHRRIGHVGGPMVTSSGARRAHGFLKALGARGLEPGPTAEATGFTIEAGREAAPEVLGAAERPSAVVAANDLVALGVLDAADAMGLSCPEDLSADRVQRHGVHRSAPSTAHQRADRRVRAGAASGEAAPFPDRGSLDETEDGDARPGAGGSGLPRAPVTRLTSRPALLTMLTHAANDCRERAGRRSRDRRGRNRPWLTGGAGC